MVPSGSVVVVTSQPSLSRAWFVQYFSSRSVSRIDRVRPGERVTADGRPNRLPLRERLDQELLVLRHSPRESGSGCRTGATRGPPRTSWSLSHVSSRDGSGRPDEEAEDPVRSDWSVSIGWRFCVPASAFVTRSRSLPGRAASCATSMPFITAIAIATMTTNDGRGDRGGCRGTEVRRQRPGGESLELRGQCQADEGCLDERRRNGSDRGGRKARPRLTLMATSLTPVPPAAPRRPARC